MNVGQVKDLIRDVPDDYILQIDTMVHPDDIDDLLAECLAVKGIKEDESKKSLFLSAGLQTLADVKVISSPPTH